MKKDKTITAVIPVKHSSSRLPGKNFLPFGEYDSLLDLKIKQLRDSKLVDDIVVSSDSDLAEEICDKLNVRFSRREKKFADESLPISHFFRTMDQIVDTDELLWACVTAPLINGEDYDAAISKWQEVRDQYESLITVMEHKHYLLDKNGPLNFTIGDSHVNSQNLPEWYLFTNGIIIRPVKDIVASGSNFGVKSYYHHVPFEKSIDIDTKWDYQMAKLIHEGN